MQLKASKNQIYYCPYLKYERPVSVTCEPKQTLQEMSFKDKNGTGG